MKDVEHLFLCILAICMSFWGRNVYLSLLPSLLLEGFVDLYKLSYILDIKTFSVTSLANILSHSVGWLFILLMVSFAVKKLSRSIRSETST